MKLVGVMEKKKIDIYYHADSFLIYLGKAWFALSFVTSAKEVLNSRLLVSRITLILLVPLFWNKKFKSKGIYVTFGFQLHLIHSLDTKNH